MAKQDYLLQKGKEDCFSLFVPVENVIKKMRYHLQIQEHINHICLGMHYTKDQSFTKTNSFRRLVEAF